MKQRNHGGSSFIKTSYYLRRKRTAHLLFLMEKFRLSLLCIRDRYVMTGLRASYDYLPLSHYQAAGKAHEILHWDRNSRFCSACGTPMEQKEDIMKRFPKCGPEVYPSISFIFFCLC